MIFARLYLHRGTACRRLTRLAHLDGAPLASLRREPCRGRATEARCPRRNARPGPLSAGAPRAGA
eukprot:6069157-Prymnesium_polylepis.1